MLRFYNSATSGHSYKVRLLLNQLELEHEMVLINSRQGETRTPEFLQINPYGQVPALQTESGYVLAESLAILIYLAEDTPLFSSDRLERAQILQWLAFEQTRIARYIAITRSWIIRGETEKYQNQIAIHHDLGTIALQIMEDHLEKHSFMVAERYTIADLALFAYTHIAEEGGFICLHSPPFSSGSSESSSNLDSFHSSNGGF